MITAHHAQGINKNSSYTKHETVKGKKKKKKESRKVLYASFPLSSSTYR